MDTVLHVLLMKFTKFCLSGKEYPLEFERNEARSHVEDRSEEEIADSDNDQTEGECTIFYHNEWLIVQMLSYWLFPLHKNTSFTS